MWRFALGFLCALMLGCAASATEPDGAGTSSKTPSSAVAAQVTNSAPQGALVHGQGTPGTVAAWSDVRTLGNSPIRVDANGDVVLKPGAALYLISADSTKCIKITGSEITFPSMSGGSCPTP